MKKRSRLIKLLPTLLISVLILGCSSSTTIKREFASAKDNNYIIETHYSDKHTPHNYRQLFESHLQRKLDELDLNAGSDPRHTHTAKIIFEEFQLRDDTERVMIGIFAGTDKVISSVEVISNAGNELVGEAIIESNNASAWASNSGLLEKHAQKVIDFLTN